MFVEHKAIANLIDYTHKKNETLLPCYFRKSFAGFYDASVYLPCFNYTHSTKHDRNFSNNNAFRPYY